MRLLFDLIHSKAVAFFHTFFFATRIFVSLGPHLLLLSTFNLSTCFDKLPVFLLAKCPFLFYFLFTTPFTTSTCPGLPRISSLMFYRTSSINLNFFALYIFNSYFFWRVLTVSYLKWLPLQDKKLISCPKESLGELYPSEEDDFSKIDRSEVYLMTFSEFNESTVKNRVSVYISCRFFCMYKISLSY